MTLHASSGNNDYFYEYILLAEEGQDLSLENVFPKYGVSLVMQETSHQELRDLNNDLPSDTHLVHYRTREGAVSSDAVRAYKLSDIFDAYHDARLTVLQIQQGYGSIRPNLYNTQRKGAKK